MFGNVQGIKNISMFRESKTFQSLGKQKQFNVWGNKNNSMFGETKTFQCLGNQKQFNVRLTFQV